MNSEREWFYMKAQDILVVLKLLSKLIANQSWSQRELADELGISVGEINASLKRNQKSGFLDAELIPVKYAIKEFLLHGFKYCFPAEIGQPTRGIKTAYAAPFLAGQFASQELPPVWLLLRWSFAPLRGDSSNRVPHPSCTRSVLDR